MEFRAQPTTEILCTKTENVFLFVFTSMVNQNQGHVDTDAWGMTLNIDAREGVVNL